VRWGSAPYKRAEALGSHKVGRALYQEEHLARLADTALPSYLSASVWQKTHRAVTKGGFTLTEPSQMIPGFQRRVSNTAREKQHADLHALV
jgi:hypothetical protein